jgi:hypothetical protein
MKELVEILNYVTGKYIKIDPSNPFEFLGIQDGGEHASCPHCGAEGRWIYHWLEYGETRAAMAGCYEMATGKIKKGDLEKVHVLIAQKLSKKKPLNGWERGILRLEQFKADAKYPPEWCDQKINEILSQRKIYLAKKW